MAGIERVLQRARAAFLRRMRARCLVERPLGSSDNGKGAVTTTYEVVANPHDDVEGTPCYVRYPGVAHESTYDLAGLSVSQSRVLVRLPFGAAYRPGDRVTILRDPDHPELAGTVYRAASMDDMSQASAQRMLCEDNQSGVAR